MAAFEGCSAISGLSCRRAGFLLRIDGRLQMCIPIVYMILHNLIWIAE